MKNIIKKIEIPDPCKIDFPVYDHITHGWYAPNSIRINDCVPIYRNSGGGVLDKYLTDLPTCVEECIDHLNERIEKAEKLKNKLIKLLKVT